MWSNKVKKYKIVTKNRMLALRLKSIHCKNTKKNKR
jgi:hypothetical protein